MCSASLFLRGLGYDVQAGRAASGCLNTADEYWFDGARTYKAKGAQALYKQLQSFGNQGKGTIGIRHKNGGGHAVYFQMEKSQDGQLRPVIYDGQIAKRYGSLSEFLRAEQADMSQFTRVTRLDGATPNWKHLAEDGVIRANFADESRKKIVDTKTGNSYYAGNFRFANPNFDSRHREEIAKSQSYYTPAPERPWITSSNPTIEQTQREAWRAADARALLKERFGIT
ncbi:MAG: hypothetical protein J6U54_25525 [Clostridiales bacterium]|nr:hypothetical protein [Clostridiales bacterium]